MKQLKLMLDYDCWPLWDQDAGDNLDPEALPLWRALQTELGEAWQVSYFSVLMGQVLYSYDAFLRDSFSC